MKKVYSFRLSNGEWITGSKDSLMPLLLVNGLDWNACLKIGRFKVIEKSYFWNIEPFKKELEIFDESFNVVYSVPIDVGDIDIYEVLENYGLEKEFKKVKKAIRKLLRR